MTHLLDTNAWLRITQNPEQISARAHCVLASLKEPVGLSAISIWEVALKAGRGKLTLRIPLDEWLRVALRPEFIRVIPLDGDMARLSAELPGYFHPDPADRFIVATAVLRKLTVVTSDERIIAYSRVPTLDTR